MGILQTLCPGCRIGDATVRYNCLGLSFFDPFHIENNRGRLESIFCKDASSNRFCRGKNKGQVFAAVFLDAAVHTVSQKSGNHEFFIHSSNLL